MKVPKAIRNKPATATTKKSTRDKAPEGSDGDDDNNDTNKTVADDPGADDSAADDNATNTKSANDDNDKMDEDDYDAYGVAQGEFARMAGAVRTIEGEVRSDATSTSHTLLRVLKHTEPSVYSE